MLQACTQWGGVGGGGCYNHYGNVCIRNHNSRFTKFLGSGAFGTVSQGVWQSPGGAMEVAIKTNQSKEEGDKVKFLQEAAIMGQFRHPNVVKLYGVVTVGEPVSSDLFK